MQTIGFIAPLLPGKTETDRSAMISCWRGERQPAHERSRQRLHITREAIFIQTTPMGDVAVVYLEADDVEAALKGMATSDDPFDRWFRDHVREVHGINVEEASLRRSRSWTTAMARAEERTGGAEVSVVGALHGSGGEARYDCDARAAARRSRQAKSPPPERTTPTGPLMSGTPATVNSLWRRYAGRRHEGTGHGTAGGRRNPGYSRRAMRASDAVGRSPTAGCGCRSRCSLRRGQG